VIRLVNDIFTERRYKTRHILNQRKIDVSIYVVSVTHMHKQHTNYLTL